MDYVWIFLLLGLGILMIVKPELLWKIEHMFSVKEGRPTDFYLAGMRLGGVFFTVCAISVLIYVLIT